MIHSIAPNEVIASLVANLLRFSKRGTIPIVLKIVPIDNLKMNLINLKQNPNKPIKLKNRNILYNLLKICEYKKHKPQ
jgi:hypothetical protein